MGILKKGLIWALIASMSMPVLSGCGSSIVLSGSEKVVVNVETVPETKAQKDKTPEEIAEEERKKEEENARMIREEEQIKEYQKYSFDVPDDYRAFYLLPAGVPLPGGVINFKVLDFNGTDTFVYAYQSLYKQGDFKPSGTKAYTDDEEVGEFIVPQYPGFKDSDPGQKGKREKYIEGPATSIKQLVSVLMKYNYKTKEYKVFFREIQPCVVKYKAKEESQSVDMVVEGEHRRGNYATLLDMLPFLTATPGNDKYAVYYQEKLTIIDGKTGEKEEHDISRDLIRLRDLKRSDKSMTGFNQYVNAVRSHGDTEGAYKSMLGVADLWSPDGLVLDKDGNIFMTVKQSQGGDLQDTNSNVDKDNTDTKQYTLSYRKDFVKQKADDNMVVFRGDNLKVDEMAQKFAATGGPHDFGMGKPSESDIFDFYGNPQNDINDIYDTYMDDDKIKAVSFTPYRKLDVTGRKDILSSYIYYDYVETRAACWPTANVTHYDEYFFEIQYDNKVKGKDNQETNDPSLQYAYYGIVPESDKLINSNHYVEVPRELEIIYWEEEEYTETDEKGKEHTKTRKVKKVEKRTEKGALIDYTEVGFPIRDLRWFNVVESRGSIMQSPFNGVTRYFTVDSLSAAEEAELVKRAQQDKKERADKRAKEEAADAAEEKAEKEAAEKRQKEGIEETEDEHFEREAAERRREERRAQRKAEAENDAKEDLIYSLDTIDKGQFNLFWNKPDDQGLYQKDDRDKDNGFKFGRRLKSADIQLERITNARGDHYTDPVIYITDPMSNLIFYNFKDTQSYRAGDWAEIVEIPKDDLSILHQKTTDDPKTARPLISYQSGGMHLVNQKGKDWLFAANVTDGLVRYDLNSTHAIGPGITIPRLGQISPYAYNMFYMDPHNDNMIYAIGFQSPHTGFTEKDLPVARVYHIDMYSQQSVKNLLYTVLQDENNIKFRHKVLDNEGTDGIECWKALLRNYNIDSEEYANQKEIEKIRRELIRKWNVGWRFLRNCSMGEDPNRYKLLNDIEKIKQVDELEGLAALHLSHHVAEEDLPISKDLNEGQKRAKVREAKIKWMQENGGYTEETWDQMLQNIYNDYFDLHGKKEEKKE